MNLRHTGFTLLELLVAMGIALVLASLAVSAYASATSRVRVGMAQAALQDAILRAQREAFVRQANVIMCASTDGEACSGDRRWEAGWIGFVDGNRDRKRQAAERLVFGQPALDEPVRVRSSSARTRLSFQPHGGAAAGSNVSFTLCITGEPSRARAVTLANSGRLRQASATRSRAEQDCL